MAEQERWTPADRDAPSFEDETGWITLAEAATRLGISKQAAHKRSFRSLRSLRSRAEYMVRESEITELAAPAPDSAAEPAPRRRTAARR